MTLQLPSKAHVWQGAWNVRSGSRLCENASLDLILGIRFSRDLREATARRKLAKSLSITRRLSIRVFCAGEQEQCSKPKIKNSQPDHFLLQYWLLEYPAMQ
jgi:hypothetical protein